jgi:hypothetical protein
VPVCPFASNPTPPARARGKESAALDAQRHDGVDYVVVVLLQGLDGLVPADVRLGHDELNVLLLDTVGVDVLLVILLLLIVLLGVGRAGGLGLAVAVAGVVVLGTAGGGELLGSGGLGGGVEVLDLGLTEDAAGIGQYFVSVCGGREGSSHVGVAVGRLVHVGVVDHEEDLAGGVSVGAGQRPRDKRRRTFLGRRRVTRVMPGILVRCSFSRSLRAFFSFLD